MPTVAIRKPWTPGLEVYCGLSSRIPAVRSGWNLPKTFEGSQERGTPRRSFTRRLFSGLMVARWPVRRGCPSICGSACLRWKPAAAPAISRSPHHTSKTFASTTRRSSEQLPKNSSRESLGFVRTNWSPPLGSRSTPAHIVASSVSWSPRSALGDQAAQDGHPKWPTVQATRANRSPVLRAHDNIAACFYARRTSGSML